MGSSLQTEALRQKLRIPAVYGPLIDQARRRRYYVAYGGRDSAKSWTFAAALLLLAQYDPLRVLCAREIQRTIADSVHRLLQDLVKLFAWDDLYEIQDARILCRTSGAEFIFAGLRDQDAHKIKSYEGVDIVWVEEAHTVTKRSWNILIPTIRADQSEIWVSFNPDLDTDETYRRFVTNPPANAWVQKVSWRDNPWFSKVLDDDREKMRREDPEEYDNVWEGNPRAVVAGAIYAKEVTAMIQQRRFRPVPYDPQMLVHTIWDLGWNDQTTIIFAQRMLSEVRIIDYEEASFLRYDEWARIIREKPYVYGGHWLPHDGDHKTQSGSGKSAKEQLSPLLKQTPKVIQRAQSVENPIRAARSLFPRVYMDNTEGEQGPSSYSGAARLMECLKRFRRGIPVTTGEPGMPVKDEYRHGADAFGQLAMIVDQLGNENDAPIVRVPRRQMHNRRVGY